MVVAQILGHNAVQVPLVEDDDVVQAFPARRANEALDKGGLPGTARRDHELFDAHALQGPWHLGTVDGVAVADQVVRCHLEGKGFAE